MVYDDDPTPEIHLPITEEERVDQPGEMEPPESESVRDRIVEVKREHPEWGARLVFDALRIRRHDIPLPVVRYVLAELARGPQPADRDLTGRTIPPPGGLY